MDRTAMLNLVLVLIGIGAVGASGVRALRLATERPACDHAAAAAEKTADARRPPPAASERTLGEAIAIAVVIGIVATSWIGLTLAELGRFSLGTLVAGLLISAAALQAGSIARAARPYRATEPAKPLLSPSAREVRTSRLPSRSGSEPMVVERSGATPREKGDWPLSHPSSIQLPSTASGPRRDGPSAHSIRAASTLVSPARLDHRVGLVGVFALAVLLFFQPHEDVLGGRDPGAYVNTGATIARTGAILIRDPIVPALTPAERALLFGETPAPWVRSGWPGYQMLDFGEGIVEPHGFHLFPVWLAIVHAVGGVQLSLFTTPTIAVLSLFSLYLLAQRLFGASVGLLAILLLAVNIAEIWYAREPAAEMLGQLLIIAGCFVFVLMLETGSHAFAVLAGLTLGLAHLAKIELIAVPLALIVFLGTEYATGRFRREYGVLLLAYGLMVGQASLHAILIAPAYTIGQAMAIVPGIDFSALNRADPDRPFTLTLAIDLARSNRRFIAASALVGVVAVMAMLTLGGRLARWYDVLIRHRRGVSIAMVGGIVTLALYAYFIRPLTGPAAPTATMAAAVLRSDHHSLVWLGWYLSPLGLALGIGGFLHLLTTTRHRGVVFVLLVAFFGTAPFLYRTAITPDHFWAVRRFLPVALPFLILFASHAIVRLRLPHAARLPIVGSSATVLVHGALVALLVVTSLRTAWPFLWHRENIGAYGQTAAIAAAIPPDAIVLLAWPDPAQRLAIPLALLFERETFALRPEQLADLRLAAFVTRWTDIGRPVYWLDAEPSDDRAPQPVPAAGLIPEPVGHFSIVLSVAEAVVERLPARVLEQRLDLQIYRLRPAEATRQR